MDPSALFAFLCGVFVIAAAALNRDRCFGNRRARFFVNLPGHDGARLFYALPGVLLFFLATVLRGAPAA